MLHYSSSFHILREGKENVQPSSSWVSLLGSPVWVGADLRVGVPLCRSWGGPLSLSPHQGSSVRLVLSSRWSAGCSVRSPLTISPCGNVPVSLLSLTFCQARASCEAPVVSRTSFCLLGAHGSLVGYAHSCFVVFCTPNPFFLVHGCTCHSRDGVMLL